jgi:hypothetical protein
MSGLDYGLGMPATKRPTAQDVATARRILLDRPAQDTDIFQLVSELAPQHPRNHTFPGEVFVRPAADALDWAAASRTDPVHLAGVRERFLPESRFRGPEKRKLQVAVLSAAALHGGAEPDLLDEVAWRQTDDFWQYALLDAVAYIRIIAGRANVPVSQPFRTWPSARPRRPADPGQLAPAPEVQQKTRSARSPNCCQFVSNPSITAATRAGDLPKRVYAMRSAVLNSHARPRSGRPRQCPFFETLSLKHSNSWVIFSGGEPVGGASGRRVAEGLEWSPGLFAQFSSRSGPMRAPADQTRG